MTRRLVGLLPFLVFAAVLVLRAWDPTPLQQLRLLVFDSYQRLEPRPHDAQAPVRIVDVDDESLARLGQWPWPRSILSQLVERLTLAGTAAIAFDIVFAEPDRSSPEQALKLWPQTREVQALRSSVSALPSHDSLFMSAVAQAPVVTAFALTNVDDTDVSLGASTAKLKDGQPQQEVPAATGQPSAAAWRIPETKATFALAGDNPRPFLNPFARAVTTLAGIEAVATGNGAINSLHDLDQVSRRIPLIFRMDEKIYPSLAAEALRVAQGARTNFIKASGASGVESFGEKTGVDAIRIGQFEIPTDSDGSMWGWFRKFQRSELIPAWRILAPDFDPNLVAGQIVFIGTSAAGLYDLRSTPLDRSIPGVAIHAQAIEQIVAGQFLHRPVFAGAVELAYMLVLGSLLLFLLNRLGAITSGLLGLGATAAVVAGSWGSFEHYGWLFDPIQPTIMVLAVYVTAEGVSYLRSETERRQVRNAFQFYLSPELVDQVSKNPDRLQLGGEQRELSVLFSDLRGFTAISEFYKDDPQGLTTFLNQFLTPMSNVILRNNGTIDKYIGDAIMAFWNAPLDDPDHSSHACRSALEMYSALADLNTALASGALEDQVTGQNGDAATADSVPAGPQNAVAEIQAAAQEGVVRAQYRLGQAYRDGNDVPVDSTLASHWFERAARQGFAPAQRNLGLRYISGDGVAASAEEALFWLTIAERNAITGIDEALDDCRAQLDQNTLRQVLVRTISWKPQSESLRSIRIDMGLGINSGDCVVGNLGSAYRFDYSVLGDTVNLASRLEGQTKTYHVPIIISEETRQRAPEFAAIELDLVTVVGKHEPTRIYALMGLPEVKASSDFIELERSHNEFLSTYRGQKWAEARKQLQKCRSLDDRLQELYDFFESRIAYLEQSSPGKDWDGVFIALEK